MNAAQEAEIRRLASEGVSQRQIAKRTGHCRPTVARVLAATPAAPPGVKHGEFIAELAARKAEGSAAPIEPAVPNTAPSIDVLRQVLADAQADCERARQLGDAANAQRWSRTIAMLMPVLQRAEREAHADTDMFSMPRSEIARVAEALRAKERAYLDRPLLCAACNRSLSVCWGTGSDPDSPDGGARVLQVARAHRAKLGLPEGG